MAREPRCHLGIMMQNSLPTSRWLIFLDVAVCDADGCVLPHDAGSAKQLRPSLVDQRQRILPASALPSSVCRLNTANNATQLPRASKQHATYVHPHLQDEVLASIEAQVELLPIRVPHMHEQTGLQQW